MRNKLSKIFFITLLLFSSLCCKVIVHGDDELDTITKLGTIDEVFPNQVINENSIMLASVTNEGEWIAKIYIENERGYDYIAVNRVGDKTVFCIEPMALFVGGQEYVEDSAKWSDLSDSQRQAIWEINYYGYSYPGHDNESYYVATQILIWEVVTGNYYTPYLMDGTTKYDIDNEVNTIRSLRSSPNGQPSFNNNTIKMGINIPVTINDSKGTLGNYAINSINGINLSVSGSSLTSTIYSENYDRQATFYRNFSARDVNIIYGSGGYQRVIYLASRRDPSPDFKLNFELLYADIEVEKQDKETGTSTQGDATFNGATFEIRDINNNVLETISTSGNKVKSRKYPVGSTLNVCEISPPEGYLNNNSCNSVELKYEGDNTKSTFNTAIKDQVIKGRIEIAKTIDSNSNGSHVDKAGKGFVFDVYLKSSNTKVATLTTDEDGRAISDLLPYGTYIIKERETKGYDTCKPFEVKIEKDQKTYFFNVYNDTLKAELTIYKVDSETGKRIPASNVSFKVKGSNDNFISQTVTYPTKYDTDVFKTDENGSVHLPSPLVYGKYKIVEISAPYGYVLKDKEIPLNVDGTSTEIFINFDNTSQKGQVYVEKYGEVLSGVEEKETDYGILYTPIYEEKYLDGVTYKITAREDIITPDGTVWFNQGDIVDTFTTKDGITTSTLLQLGKYSIQEIETKVGYVLDETVYDFDIEYASQMIDVVEIKQSYVNNRQKLHLDITKTFEDNDANAYKDVLFGIYTSEDILKDDEVLINKDSLVGLLNLDSNNKTIEQYDLPIGEYYIKELKTNVGFLLDSDKHDFTFEYDEDTTKDEVIVSLSMHNNKRRIELDISKVDKDHQDHFLNGAIFEVYDKSLNSYIGKLSSGQLLIEGSDINQEYEIAKDEEFKDIVKTVKTDENKLIILDMDEGTYYSRKVNDDKVTKHIIKDGKAVLINAIYGHEYEFKEIKAPTSYKLADKSETYKIEVDEKTDTLNFNFSNERIVLPNTGL